MSVPAKPTYLQSAITTVLLLLLLVITAPLTFTISSVIYLVYSRHVKPAAATASNGDITTNTKITVLITGARTTKSLTLCRIFWKAGYRVVLADEAEWGRFASARFSRCISAYYNLPNPLKGHDRYEESIRHIVRKENVKLWVPGSSAAATVNDALVAETIRKTENGVQVFIQSPREIEQLHNKDLFADLCKELDFKVPESILVYSTDEAVNFLHDEEERQGRKYIVKCTALDDQGRSDLTQLPFDSPAKTRAHLAKLPRPITESSPYVLQQYISGYEFCTHSHAVDGVMQSFLSCPSSDMLMRYMDCRTDFSASIADDAEQWTRDLLERWSAKLKTSASRGGASNYRLTGHFSFDFIVDSEGTLYPIECNPRIHTAIVLLAGYDPSKMAASYFGKKENGLICPPETARERFSWTFHALPLALADYILPKSWQRKLHPLLEDSSLDIDPLECKVPAITISPPVRSTLDEILANYVSGSEKDPMLDLADPMPFAMQNLTWFWLLFRLVFIQGKGWSRVNVSTSRLFSC